jgi:hypothetical protein
MQAQSPLAPYVGLWSRLDGFRAEELSGLITERAAVRATLMRGTIHLAGARDALMLRPLVEPVIARGFGGSPFARRVDGLDLDELRAAARALVEERPLTRSELGPLLAERWPGRDPEALAYAATYLLPLVQVPPRGVWGGRGQATWTTMASWLGRPLEPQPSVDAVVLRYLGAYGPAGAKDVQTWSGLTRVAAVLERLRPQLATFSDERGRELFDLPDAPRPDPGTPAPPRFLPEYDNVLLSHADRTRVMPADRRVPLPPGNGARVGTVLVDGIMRARWRIAADGGAAMLVVEPYEPLSQRNAAAVRAEGRRLLRFAAAGAGAHEVQVRSAGVPGSA